MLHRFRAVAALCLMLHAVWAAVIAVDVVSDSTAAQHHCGGKCPSRGATAGLQVFLRGLGAHRHLHCRVTVRCPHQGGSAGAGAAAGANTQPPPCGEAALLQPLPPAVYADVYQLDNAARLGQGPAVRLFGPLDVESIERFSQPTVLAVYSGNLSAAGGNQVPGRCAEAGLEVPLHARYPHPRTPGEREERGPGAVGWLSAALSVAATVELPLPLVLVRCAGGAWQAARLEAADAAIAPVRWDMPAGNLRHGPVVAVGTAAAMALGAAAVLLAVFGPQDRPSPKQKRG